MRAGDLLAPHALAEVVLRLASEPEVDLLYSDDDRCDDAGRRFEPFFKPDWSPDLMRSVNYVGPFVVVRRALLETVGGLLPELRGARRTTSCCCACRSGPSASPTCQRVLYHRRVTDGGSAGRPRTRACARWPST